ncbi:MAG: hypothetical protein AAF352_05430, partial [Pseudomonadota bacterium]
DTYDLYIGQTSAFCAMDYKPLRDAFRALITNSEKRATMGAAAKKHVAQNFDWRHIIARYQELWAELQIIRSTEPDLMPTAKASRNPHALDPFQIYRGYPTALLSDHTVVTAFAGASADVLVACMKKPFFAYIGDLLPRKSEMGKVFSHLHAHGPTKVKDLMAIVEQSQQIRLARAIVLCAKLELVHLGFQAPAE